MEHKDSNDAGISADVKTVRNLWEHRLDEISEKNKANPFSSSFEANSAAAGVDKDHYGRPVDGSLTEARGKQASAWVDHEVDRLIEEITKIGQYDETEGGMVTVTFGKLFLHYQDISNTVVGILMRAKKRHRVKYLGEMLYQHTSDNVKITVI